VLCVSVLCLSSLDSSTAGEAGVMSFGIDQQALIKLAQKSSDDVRTTTHAHAHTNKAREEERDDCLDRSMTGYCMFPFVRYLFSSD
jgi:hypothetical protein